MPRHEPASGRTLCTQCAFTHSVILVVCVARRCASANVLHARYVSNKHNKNAVCSSLSLPFMRSVNDVLLHTPTQMHKYIWDAYIFTFRHYTDQPNDICAYDSRTLVRVHTHVMVHTYLASLVHCLCVVCCVLLQCNVQCACVYFVGPVQRTHVCTGIGHTAQYEYVWQCILHIDDQP